MNTLTASEYTAQKSLHLAVRAALRAAHKLGGDQHRYAILASAFIRGRAYRRHERSHRTTSNMDGSRFEHHMPHTTTLARFLAPFLPEIAADLPKQKYGFLNMESPTYQRLSAWIENPDGAKPAPAPRVKAPYAGQRGNARDSAVAAE